MARKNDTDDAVGVVIFIIMAIAVIGYFLIKWAIIGFSILIVVISIWIINLYRKEIRKKTISNIIKNVFIDSNIKPVAKINKKELKEKLGIFDMEIYNNLFESKIKQRGLDYYFQNKVQNVKINGNTWFCTINGSNKYNVSISFDENKIIDMNCNCPYYKDDNKNCKHIYALLIKAKSEKNISIILNAITGYANKLTKMINEENKYINENKNNMKLSLEIVTEFQSNTQNFTGKIKNLKNDIRKYQYNEVALLDILIDLIVNSYYYNKEFEKFIIKTGKIDNFVSIKKTSNTNKDEIKLNDIIEGYIVADEISKKLNNKNKTVDERLEKEMDEYCLEDWQKELVRKRRI